MGSARRPPPAAATSHRYLDVVVDRSPHDPCAGPGRSGRPASRRARRAAARARPWWQPPSLPGRLGCRAVRVRVAHPLAAAAHGRLPGADQRHQRGDRLRPRGGGRRGLARVRRPRGTPGACHLLAGPRDRRGRRARRGAGPRPALAGPDPRTDGREGPAVVAAGARPSGRGRGVRAAARHRTVPASGDAVDPDAAGAPRRPEGGQDPRMGAGRVARVPAGHRGAVRRGARRARRHLLRP
jgi:hypothetical protein